MLEPRTVLRREPPPAAASPAHGSLLPPRSPRRSPRPPPLQFGKAEFVDLVASPGGRVQEIKVRERRVPSYEKDKEEEGRPDGKAYRERVVARLLAAYAGSKNAWLWNDLGVSTTVLVLVFGAVAALLAESVLEVLVLLALGGAVLRGVALLEGVLHGSTASRK